MKPSTARVGLQGSHAPGADLQAAQTPGKSEAMGA